MNIIQEAEHLSGTEMLALVALALAEERQRCHPRRVALPKGYDATGKTTHKVHVETGLSSGSVWRLFRRLGLPLLPYRATHCRRAGHEFTKDNTYLRPNGKRECRSCLTMVRKTAEYRAMLRARYRQKKRMPHAE